MCSYKEDRKHANIALFRFTGSDERNESTRQRRGPRQDTQVSRENGNLYPAKDSARLEWKDFGIHQSDKQIHIYSVARARSNGGMGGHLISVQYSFDCHRLLLVAPGAIQFH